MDVPKKITLHIGAKNFLFENFAILRRIFSDVLGQMEIDFLSIALINKENELFILSSNPSSELNVIEKGLWKYDNIYNVGFIYQNESKLWSELYPIACHVLLKRYKLVNQQLVEGISIPIDFKGYRVILSFGFKKAHTLKKIKSDNQEELIALGRYCLNKINKVILFPDQKKCSTKPKLTLVINKLGEL